MPKEQREQNLQRWERKNEIQNTIRRGKGNRLLMNEKQSVGAVKGQVVGGARGGAGEGQKDLCRGGTKK